jgi:hypothetical protein
VRKRSAAGEGSRAKCLGGKKTFVAMVEPTMKKTPREEPGI